MLARFLAALRRLRGLEQTDYAPALNGRGTIRLTFFGEHMASAPVEFATDDLGEALAAYGRKHFSGGPPSSGPPAWIVAFVVENGEARMSPQERLERVKSVAAIETWRATR